MIDLRNLSSSQFEELTYDLLREGQATDLSWRKGTPLPGTSGDSGRDIECSVHFSGLGGETFVDRRFVQCKHYSQGVPPDRLESGLTWATAGRPDTLLFVVSGFLSNPAKDFLREYEINNRPPFRIQFWENPDLELRLQTQPALLRKYRISAPEPELQILHPAHVTWATTLPVLSLTKLFGLLDALDPADRGSLTALAGICVIQPTVRKPVTGKESFIELVNEDISYAALRRKALAWPVDHMFTAAAMVSLMVGEAFNAGNYLRASGVQTSLRDFNNYLTQLVTKGQVSQGYAERTIVKNEQLIADTEPRLRQGYERYLRFCDRVLAPLLAYRPSGDLPDWAQEVVARELGTDQK